MQDNSNSEIPDCHPEFLSKGQNPSSSQKNRIFLIGMPGAGKTYWGSRIAAEYNIQFTDLDTFIAEQELASIPALFAQYGEKGFREREHKYLKKLISAEADYRVIACGGGTPCFFDNMALMKDAGTVIYLQADIDTLVANIGNSEEIRPLLRGKGDISAYLTDLLQKRKAAYEQGQYILHTQDISLATFDKIISICINRH